MDTESREFIGSQLIKITDFLEWDDCEAIVYIAMDDAHRPFNVWKNHLGSDQSKVTYLYHKKDEEFLLEIQKSERKEYHFVVY